jgi:hypothetical protein
VDLTPQRTGPPFATSLPEGYKPVFSTNYSFLLFATFRAWAPLPKWQNPLMTNVSRSLGQTGSYWGLKKRHKDRHRESWNRVGPALLMGDADDPFLLQVYLFIQHAWESREKSRSSSHGSSRIGSRNSAAVVCCYLVQTILTRSVCPVFPARQLC